MIQQLPPEIFRLVIEKLRMADLKSLSQVSKHTSVGVAPVLWRSITIEPTRENAIHRITTSGFPPRRLPLVKQFRLRSDFQLASQDRCPHVCNDGLTELSRANDDGNGLQDTENYNAPFIQRTQNVKKMLEKFEKGGLRSFSWELGTCIPSEILGPSGIVSLNQRSLTSLSLITNPNCFDDLKHDSEIDLSSFLGLRSLSWKGPHSRLLETLSSVLRSNAKNLQEIHLDFLDWQTLAEDMKDYGEGWNEYFLDSVLKLHKSVLPPVFPNLRVLSLSQIPLREATALVTNFSTLCSLTLRQCHGWHEFLEGVLELKQPIHLKKLEIHDSNMASSGYSSFILRSLLMSFEGLEELYVCEPGPFNSVEFWQYFVHHRSSLRRFLSHQRTLNSDEESPYYEEELDVPDLGIFGRQLRRIKKDVSANPLTNLDLECIGLSCIPERLEYILQPFVLKSTLRLLHIRQSSSDLGHYASLAFNNLRLDAENTTDVSSSPIVEFGSQDTEYDDSEDEDSESEDFLYSWVDSGNQSDTEEEEDPLAVDMRQVDSQTAGILARLRKEFVQFVAWAFGPRGVASLQTVAFGDFSHGRFSDECMMVCRVDDGPLAFRILGVCDAEFHDIFEDYRDMLEACPMQPLME